MKKKWMKFTSMLLAAVMVLSMAMTGLAAEVEPMSSSENTSFTITVTNASSGETYSAYKIFDVTYDDNGNYAYTIDSDSAWYDTVAAATDVFTLTQINGSGTYNVTVNDGVTDDKITAVFTSEGVPEGAVAAATATPTFTSNQDGSTTTGSVILDVSNSGAGYYYVTTTLGSLVSISTTNPTATITDKNTPPVPEKKVDENESESNENKRTVEYEITAAPINDIVKLVIEDSMTVDEGVTYKFDADSLAVTLYESQSAEGTELTTSDYTFVYNSLDGTALLDDGCDFHVVFREDYDFSKYTSSAYIEVTIKCTIDAGKYQFEDDEVVIENNARVGYGNNGKSIWDEADVYEYGFEIYKYTGNEHLAGAEFVLSKEVDEEGTPTVYYAIFTEYGGKYILDSWTANINDATHMISTDSANIYVEGLAEDTYILTEVVAPDGYNMLTDDIYVTITVSDTDKSVFTVTYTIGEEGETTNAEDHVVNVENNSGTILPGTGGMGTTIFYIVGIVLMIGAAAFFVTRKRISKEN